MNVEQLLLNAPLPTLLAVFFNSDKDVNDGDFYVDSTYRKGTSIYSSRIQLPDSSYEDTARRLTKKYGLQFTQKNNVTVRAKITNNLHLELDDFRNRVYEAILPKIVTTNINIDFEMALAMFSLRGSADFKFGYYAVDLKKPTKRYVDNLFKVLLSSDELLSRLNLNFREMQPQYVSGTQQRNTQIRINLKWYYDNVVTTDNGNLNQYKTDLMSANIQHLGDVRIYNSFEERLIIYRESVLGRKLSASEIASLRNDLEFDRHEKSLLPTESFTKRNQQIVSFARETFEDVCVGCGHKYKIEDRSFIMPRNNRYYFEINHVIAYANNSTTVDVVDNLVKLCPTCHRALTPGRAFPEYQKEIINQELQSRPEVKQFILSMMPHNCKDPIDFVFQNLK